MRSTWTAVAVLAIAWTSCATENVEDKSANRDKRHSAIIAIIKHHRGRILHHRPHYSIKGMKPPPLKQFHNGPYHINHYFHCLGHATEPPNLPELIKSEEVHLHLPNDKFQVQFGSDKTPFTHPLSSGTISIGNNFGSLESHGFGINEQFSIEDHSLGHKSHELDLSGPILGSEENFGITTDNIGFNSHSFENQNHHFEVVPSLQFELQSGGDNSKEYEGESLIGTSGGNEGYKHQILGHEHSGNLESLTKIKVPQLQNHPLEHDPTKSSYDTPGAVDSYGDPIRPKTSNFPPKTPIGNYGNSGKGTKIEDYFSAEIGATNQVYGGSIRLGRQLKKEDETAIKLQKGKSENLVGNKKNITELVKSMRMNRNITIIETNEYRINNNTSDKHPNHKYDD